MEFRRSATVAVVLIVFVFCGTSHCFGGHFSLAFQRQLAGISPCRLEGKK